MISMKELRHTQLNIICLGSNPTIVQSMLDYDYLCGKSEPIVVGIISQGRKQERYFWGESEIELPVFARLDDLPAALKTTVNCVLNVQSGRRALSSMREALEALPALQLAMIFAERVPESHALQIAELAQQHQALVIGPASVGMLVPGSWKLGAIGGTEHAQISAAHILTAGDTAVISTSGGMVNEFIHAVTTAGLGISFAVALGGDLFPATPPAEAFLLAEADPRTKQIVYFGELGGHDEYDIAQLIRDGKLTKKIVAYIAGTVAELFATPPQFGHAKAMAQTQDESAAAKKIALREVGVTVLESLTDLTSALAKITVPPNAVASNGRTIGPRCKRLIASHLSGEKNGHMQLLGDDLLTVVERNSLASLALSMLLGHQVTSERLITCTDYVLRLLADHGPYVSGAMNTIVAARAGKDLVSSLASGLLTIGPRFGGAINDAANQWLRGLDNNFEPKQFVEDFRGRGGIIPGIGHKRYRLESPDPRITALRRNVGHDGAYLTFALSVQAVTTTKKSNLILNVDGAIAAVLLDLLHEEMGYDHQQLQQLVDIEFFNALFVLSRSIGLTAHYLDQRRHDEGLLRLSDDDVSYFA